MAAIVAVHRARSVRAVGHHHEHHDHDDAEVMPTEGILLDLEVRRRLITAAGILWQKRRAVVTSTAIIFGKPPPEDAVLDDVDLLEVKSVERCNVAGLSQGRYQNLRVEFLGGDAPAEVVTVRAVDTIATAVSSANGENFTFCPRQHTVKYRGVPLDSDLTLEEYNVADGDTVCVGATDAFLQDFEYSNEPTKRGWIYKKGGMAVRRDRTLCTLALCGHPVYLTRG